jgi:hypothetical protein
MNRIKCSTTVAVAGAALAADLAEAGPTQAECDAWLARLQSEDDKTRAEAWYGAGPMGAAVVPQAAALVSNPNREISLAASRALQRIALYSGKPGADADRVAVVGAFVKLLDGKQTVRVRLVAVSALSEIAGDEAVDAIAALLVEPDLREPARMALERVPGEKSLAALRNALAQAPADFKPNLAQSIRRRGIEVPELPDGKLTPSKPTQVQTAPAPTKN